MKSNNWKARAILCAITLCAITLGATHSVRAQKLQANPAVDQFIRDAGYTYKRVAEGVWLIERQGTNLPKFQIIVASGQGLVVASVVLAEKKKMNVTSEMMFKLMKLNYSLDYVKAGFDDDDDLIVRSDFKTRLLDLQEFKEGITQLSAAADEIYSVIKPFLTSP